MRQSQLAWEMATGLVNSFQAFAGEGLQGLAKYDITEDVLASHNELFPSRGNAKAVIALNYYQAENIWLRMFWEPLRCHQLPAAIAVTLFDTALTCGKSLAVEWLQDLLQIPKTYCIDETTIKALNRPNATTAYLACRLMAQRHEYAMFHSLWAKDHERWVQRMYAVIVNAGYLERVSEIN